MRLETNTPINPRTAGGLSHLRTAGGGGGHICAPPRLTLKVRNVSTSGKEDPIGLKKL